MNDKLYSELSYDITKSLSSKDKKQYGIFFTPNNIIEDCINFVLKHINPQNILEPSCGSCEFVKILNKRLKLTDIDAIELNEKIYDKIQHIDWQAQNTITLYELNYLEYMIDKKYDLIIGNPPYFVMKKKEVDEKYNDYYEGRPNIFILFIVKSLWLLNDNGILSFVIPKSFVNSVYYNKLRDFINKNYTILKIFEYEKSKFIDTEQETITLIIQKKQGDNNDYVLIKDNIVLFNTPEKIIQLREYYKNSTTLKALGFEAKIGTVVWNQVKDKLTHDESNTLLIYSGDIKDNKLSIQKYKNIEKKNYIDKEGINDVLLVVNRGYGNAKYNFTYCLIDMEKEYLVENHLICIKSKEKRSNEELRECYTKIINSFENEKTKKFIGLYFGNNAINTAELNEILPIY
tara:strand:+ start:1002 stop:2210 length:1209 start_codon:yes stop_codon:yes gene_type:complete